jgi:hypothetical protein
MSDNTRLNPGLGGDLIATKDTGTAKIPRSLLVNADNDNDVGSSNPLPVAGTVTVVQGTAANLQAQVSGTVNIGNSPTVTVSSITSSSGLATATHQTDGSQKTQISNGTNQASVLNTNPSSSEYGLVVRNQPGSTIQQVSGSVTSNIGTTGGLALDATLTGGTQKSQLVNSSGNSAQVANAAPGTNDYGLVVRQAGTSTVSGSVTVSQGTAANLRALVDVNSLPSIPAGSNVIGAVTQSGAPWSVSVSNNPTISGIVTAIPADASHQISGLFDLDSSGTTHDRQLGVSLRGSASGGSVELGGSAHPLHTTVDNSITVGTLPSVTVSSMPAVQLAAGSAAIGSVSIAQGGNTALVNSSGALSVNIGSSTVPVTQSGTWTVQPGNTANTTPWLATINQGGHSATVTASNALKVDGSGVTQPVSQTGAPWSVSLSGTSAITGNVIPTDGTNPISKTIDLDSSGSTHEYQLGVSLRGSASGGSVELGTSSHPLHVSADNSLTIGSLPSIPAGSASIGSVSLNAGSNSLGTVGLNAGSNLVGSVKLSDGTHTANITTGSALMVDASATVQPVSQSGTWNVGLSAGNNIAGQFKLTNGTNVATVDGSGNLSVNVVSGVTVADEAAFTEGTTGLMAIGGYYKASPATLTTGQAGAVSLTAHRAFHANLRDTSGNEINTSNGLAVQPAIGTSWTVAQGTAAAGSAPWPVCLVEDTSNTKVNVADATNKAIRVNLVAGGGSSGTSLADKSTFTQGSTFVTPIAGEYTTSPTALTTGQAGAIQATANRALHINLRDSSGNELGTSSNGIFTQPIASSVQQVVIASPLADALSNLGMNAAGQANTLSLPGYSGCALTITGTWSATLVMETTCENPAGTWTQCYVRKLGTSGDIAFDGLNITANGVYVPALPPGCHQVRVRVSSYTSGSIVTTLLASNSRDTMELHDGADGQGIPPVAVAIGANDGSNFHALSCKATTPSGSENALVTRPIPSGTQNINVSQVAGGTAINSGVTGALAMGGDTGSGSTDAGNPLKIGAQARSSEMTAVANGQRANLVSDLVGKLITLPYANPENFIAGNVTSIDTATHNLFASQGAGVRSYITSIQVSNSSSSNVLVTLTDGTSTIYLPAPANGGSMTTLTVPFRSAAATAVTIQSSSGVSTISVSAQGYKGV